MSVIVFACVLSGTFVGIFLRNSLPKHHLSGATKDVVKLGTGLIGTIAAQISIYDEIVTSSVSSAGSMMPTSIDPHALHFKL